MDTRAIKIPTSFGEMKSCIKPECLDCPCFEMRGCNDCDHASTYDIGECDGQYPQDCEPEDCVGARFDLETLRLTKTLDSIYAEWKSACEKHAPMHGPHEGLAVIWEEFEELKAEVFKREHGPEKMRKEAARVAAMTLRFILDVCPPDVSEIFRAEMARRTAEAGETSEADEAPPAEGKAP